MLFLHIYFLEHCFFIKNFSTSIVLAIHNGWPFTYDLNGEKQITKPITLNVTMTYRVLPHNSSGQGGPQANDQQWSQGLLPKSIKAMSGNLLDLFYRKWWAMAKVGRSGYPMLFFLQWDSKWFKVKKKLFTLASQYTSMKQLVKTPTEPLLLSTS